MIRFNDYFKNWLYDLNNGYYSNYKQIGKEGDFFTSVSVSSLFGGSIAKKIISSIESGFLPSNTTIVEVGAHHGYLLADVIQYIYTLKPTLLSTLNFAIVERFDNLQQKQKSYLDESFGDNIKLSFYKDLSEIKTSNAFILANEIFDAFECDMVYTTKTNELQLAFVENGKIEFKKCEDEEIIKHCEKYFITKGEVALSYKDFIDTIFETFDKFEFLTFDYGDKYPRNDISLRIYEKHNVFPIFDEEIKLNELYQKSDITYDVHFNYLKDLFEEKNVEYININTQANSLIDFGLLDLLEIIKANVSETSYLKEAQKAKMLIEPTGMGDRFKVLNVRKDKK